MASLQRVNQGTWPVHAGSVPLLQCYGQSVLWNRVFVASIASHIRDPAAQIIQKFQTISAPGACRNLTSQRHKYIIAAHLGIFGKFLGSSSLGYPPSTDGSVTDIGMCQRLLRLRLFIYLFIIIISVNYYFSRFCIHVDRSCC